MFDEKIIKDISSITIMNQEDDDDVTATAPQVNKYLVFQQS